MKDLISVKLKEIVKLQDIIKKGDLNYKSKRGKTYNFSNEILMKDIYHQKMLIISKVTLLLNIKILKKATKALEKKIF